MAGTTPALALPYPTGGDQPFVHLDVKALADAVDAAIANRDAAAEWEYTSLNGPTPTNAESYVAYANRPRAIGVTATAAGALVAVTITRAGLYTAAMSCRLAPGTGGTRAISVEHQGAAGARIRRATAGVDTTGATVLTVSGTFRCAAGDLLRPIIYTLPSLATDNTLSDNSFTGQWVRP